MTDAMESPLYYSSIQKPGNGEELPRHGLTIITTAVFAVGEMAGSGVLSLPNALVGTGYIGIAINVACAFVSAFTGVLLGKCWLMVLDRFPEYREQNRNPYPTIGLAAFGRVGKFIVSCSINLTLFGVSVVFLLLSSENIQSLIADAGKDFSFCYWLLIVAGCLCPLTYLGTPKDFWPIAVGAVIATSLACVITVVQIVRDGSDPSLQSLKPGINVKHFFMAFGAICFAFGGHPAFPTFQADMKRPEDFGKAISLSYFIVLAMYLPVAVSGYVVYGGSAQTNILKSMSTGPIRSIVEVLITMHLICSFVIVINPVCQELEELLKIPKEFTWKRIVTRTILVGAVLFVAESVPHFGVILDLIGGSTTTLLAYILPPLFYLRLSSQEGLWQPEYVPLHIKVACAEVLIIGVVAGGASTYAAIDELITSSFSTPCYINITSAG